MGLAQGCIEIMTVMFPARNQAAGALRTVLSSLGLSVPKSIQVGSALAMSRLLTHEDLPSQCVGGWMLAPITALPPTPAFPPVSSFLTSYLSTSPLRWLFPGSGLSPSHSSPACDLKAVYREINIDGDNHHYLLI